MGVNVIVASLDGFLTSRSVLRQKVSTSMFSPHVEDHELNSNFFLAENDDATEL
jgi:hypothetical protein